MRLRSSVLRSLLAAPLSLLAALAACTVTNETTSDGGADAGTTGSDSATIADSTTTADSAADAQTGPLGFTPSNIDFVGLDLSKPGDVIISGANCGILDTETLGWSCVDPTTYAAETITFGWRSSISALLFPHCNRHGAASLGTFPFRAGGVMGRHDE